MSTIRKEHPRVRGADKGYPVGAENSSVQVAGMMGDRVLSSWESRGLRRNGMMIGRVAAHGLPDDDEHLLIPAAVAPD
jgi:hypothetical protein